MKKESHPAYQEVLFIDSASGHRFVCGSTMRPKAVEAFEGKEYPVVYLSISSSSHPFFTGSKQLVDSEGRVEKFKKRFDRKKEASKDETGPDSEDKKDEKVEVSQEPVKVVEKKTEVKAVEKKPAVKAESKKKR